MTPRSRDPSKPPSPRPCSCCRATGMSRPPIVCSSLRSRAAKASWTLVILSSPRPSTPCMLVCRYGGEEDLWQSFEDAMARSDVDPARPRSVQQDLRRSRACRGGGAGGARVGDLPRCADERTPPRSSGSGSRPPTSTGSKGVDQPCGASSTTRVAVARSHQASPRGSCWPETISRRAIGMRPNNWLERRSRSARPMATRP